MHEKMDTGEDPPERTAPLSPPHALRIVFSSPQRDLRFHTFHPFHLPAVYGSMCMDAVRTEGSRSMLKRQEQTERMAHMTDSFFCDESEHLTAADIEDDDTKVWKNSAGQYSREGDLPTTVFCEGGMIWESSRYEDYGGLPSVLRTDGTSVFWKRGFPGETMYPEQVRSIEYAGVDYCVPWWMVEGYRTSREDGVS